MGGQILGSLVGLGLRHAIHVPWVVSPLAMALALTVMQLTSTTHPPGLKVESCAFYDCFWTNSLENSSLSFHCVHHLTICCLFIAQTGGATALIIASMDEIPRWAGFSYVAGVAGGCAVMLAVALIVNNLSPHRRYPTFWW